MKKYAVKSPMTARVVQIEVELGQELQESQTVAIIESMKMEIPIVTTSAGTVHAIQVETGDFINENDIIAIIKN